MEILSRKIKIPNSIQSLMAKHAFTRWENYTNKHVSILQQTLLVYILTSLIKICSIQELSSMMS